MWSCKRHLLIVLVLLLAACGFEPIYGTKNQQSIKTDLASIQIAPIKDRIGQQMRNHLLDQINLKGQTTRPKYKLVVTLSESKQELAVQKSELATRANLHIAAHFNLAPLEGVSAQPLVGSVKITTSYNILSSDFGTLMAEQDARRRAVRELSLELTNHIAAHIK